MSTFQIYPWCGAAGASISFSRKFRLWNHPTSTTRTHDLHLHATNNKPRKKKSQTRNVCLARLRGLSLRQLGVERDSLILAKEKMPAPSSTPPSKCWAKFVYQKISAVAFIQDKQGDLPASSTAYFAIGSWDDHADNSLSVWAVDGWATGRGAGMLFGDVGVEFHSTSH